MIQNRHTYTGNQGQNPKDNIQKVEIHNPPHISILHVDSMDKLEFTTYANPRFEVNSEIMRRGINKIAMSEITVHSDIPNLNDRNLTIKFESGMGVFEVDLITGFYEVSDLMDHIVLRLNTVTGASGLTWQIQNLYGNFYNISTVGGNFKFLSSSHIDRAEPLSGLLITDNFVSQQFVSAGGLYTRYVDFVSTDFKESQILENLFTKDYKYNIINHFYRYDMQSGSAPFQDRIQVRNLSYSSVRSKERNIITLELFDQFGDLLFAPKITFENNDYLIELFKYELKLSIST